MLCSIEGTLLWLLLFTFQCTQASSIIAYYLNINKVDKNPWTGDRSSLLPVVPKTLCILAINALELGNFMQIVLKIYPILIPETETLKYVYD